MRKIFLLAVILFTFKSFGQTYTVGIIRNYYGGCHGGKTWSLTGSNLIGSGSFITAGITNATYTTVPLSSSYELTTNFTCTPLGPATLDCLDNTTTSQSAAELIKGNLIESGGCAGSVSIIEFRPNNMSIVSNKSSICTGEQLDFVISSPAGFPNEAYHWQFSIDNQATWTDVPSPFNFNPIPNFSINNLLGANYENYFNEQIYFRLGYDQNRPFSNVISITYSPCGPTISNIAFVGPECNGDIVKSLAITFAQKLNSTIGEKLAFLTVCDITSNSTMRMQINGPVSYPDDTKTYTYNTSDLQQLETGHYYKIRYQAQITDPDDSSKTILTGVLDSPAALNFLNTDPLKMEFKITNYSQPSCFGGNDGTAEIQILSGQSPYHFYKDGVELTGASQPTLNNGKYYITGLQEKTYNIMVTDSKKCIDKTAND
ncbi:hypothetical protein DOS84_11720 [Flavobacterium aquariorum]|uniref:SprB repeat-containing protein n=1 Tax=Flavobacterium aquariorum TaxID=2217670 RepID=A0A2W7TS35_9FLAO|nr:hypothetical protein [Flavobacterium aquariorum]PZX93031.1 hypothetical protein DOS84_11720 [Flavobacterium aquariorum]